VVHTNQSANGFVILPAIVTDKAGALFQKDRLNTSFSTVKYANIASFVGLNSQCGMTDIKTFQLHRSRIPTAFFKSIVQDIDIRLVEYGPPMEHDTERARAQFLSPVSMSQTTLDEVEG